MIPNALQTTSPAGKRDSLYSLPLISLMHLPTSEQ
jgi:hypothetical protein